MDALNFVENRQDDMCRPTIMLNMLDVSKVDKSKINNRFYDFLEIPLVTPQRDDEKFIQEQTFCFLADQVADNFNDVYPQSQDLYLIVDDNDGERKYYIGADVQIEDWDGVSTEPSIKEISLTVKEEATVELALLKVINPEQFLLKYTRCQLAQRPEIENRFGFYNDCIDKQGTYRSTWISNDCKTGILGNIENVKDENSKIHFQPIGA